MLLPSQITLTSYFTLIFSRCRSLLDVLTETSAIAKGYTLLSMIPVLGAEEIHLLSEQLPSECQFLRQKGLIHLLPAPLQSMLSRPTRGIQNNSKVTLNEETNINQNTVGDSFGSNSSFFALPSFLSESSANQHNRSSSLPSTPRSDHILPESSSALRTRSTTNTFNVSTDNQNMRNNTLNGLSGRHDTPADISLIRRMRSTNATNRPGPGPVPATALMVPLPQGDFERTLQDILTRKTKVTTDWFVDKIKTAAISNLYYFSSGGDVSDQCLVGLIGLGALGVTIGTSMQHRIQCETRRALQQGGLVDTIGNTLSVRMGSYSGIGQLLKNTVQGVVTYGVPCMTTLTITMGSMLAVRKIQQNRPADGFTSLLSSAVILPMARNFLKKLQCSAVKIFSLGRFHDIDDPMFLIVVSAWTLTAFVAVKFRRNVKHLKWIFNVIISRLLNDWKFKFNGETSSTAQ